MTVVQAVTQELESQVCNKKMLGKRLALFNATDLDFDVVDDDKMRF